MDPSAIPAESKYDLVRAVLTGLDLPVTHRDDEEEVLVVNDDERGLTNLILDVEDPILVLEMPILPLDAAQLTAPFLTKVLQWNRELVHGAFVLDAEGSLLLWRDTLALEALDGSEIEASIHALEIALAEHAAELLDHRSGERPHGGAR